jgi:Fur family ferric uptake transcriptional regulator
VQKKEVLCALKHKPQSVLEILSLLKQKKTSIDKVTVYRILTSFAALGVVREIFLGDRETRYELVSDEHHHHLVCEECGSIEDVELSEETLLKEVAKQSKFKIKSHSLEFFGTCKRCQ